MAGPQGTELSYIGKGSFSARVKGAAAGMLPLGNVSAANVRVTEDKKELLDYQSAGGGQANALRRIQTVELGLTLRDFTADNIAKALFGAASVVAAATGVTETVVGYEDALTPLGKAGITNLVVKDSTDTTTYVAGTDYDLVRSGLWVRAGGAITSGATLHLTYDHPAQNVVEALVNSGLEYEVFLDGLNEAQSGKAVAIRFHRLRFGPVADWGLIADEYGELALTADLLKDTTIVTAGLSQYMKVAYV
jgi:hypothetical protein